MRRGSTIDHLAVSLSGVSFLVALGHQERNALADHGMMGMTVAGPHGGGQSIYEACLVMPSLGKRHAS